MKTTSNPVLHALAELACILAIALGLSALFALFAGCTNTGTYANVGRMSAPIELSDASDTYTIRALFSMDGAKAWSRKNSRTKLTYTNTYTNSYAYGMIESAGVQNFGVEVEPTIDEAEERE